MYAYVSFAYKFKLFHSSFSGLFLSVFAITQFDNGNEKLATNLCISDVFIVTEYKLRALKCNES